MSDPAPIVAVEIPFVGDERHKHWAKVVTDVDPSRSSGWAYVGEFISVGGIQDVSSGSVILVYGERGSRANPLPEAQIFVANADGTLSEHESARGRAWARTLRDPVMRLLETDLTTHLDWRPDLLAFDAYALAEELVRRGWTVTPPEETS